jgi:hypothetical protein
MPMLDFPKRGGLLKGSHLVEKAMKIIGGVILDARVNVPGINAPVVIDFDTEILPGITAWPCNRTEADKLIEKISPVTENWRGWGIVLGVEMKNNPKTKTNVPGLVIVAVMKPAEAAKKRTKKATLKLESRVSSGVAPANWDDREAPPF